MSPATEHKLGSLLPHERLLLLGVLVSVAAAHFICYRASEPFFLNDEARHFMTGIFFRDFLVDLPLRHPRDYALNYYMQYPGIGVLIWPPFFHFLEGLLMLAFGIRFLVCKILIVLLALTACAYLFQLIRLTHDAKRAATATLLFAFSPLIFAYSQQVMLEIPTLAFALAATYHFHRFLSENRRRDLVLAALASALAALTRFDAVYLLVFFCFVLVFRKRFGILRRKDVLLSLTGALLAVFPAYWLSYLNFGWMQLSFVGGDPNARQASFLGLKNLLFYPAYIPQQIGWFALLPAAAGFCWCLRKPQRPASSLYIVMLLATYLTFTPLGDKDPRHAIYWVPALALFAAEGIFVLSGWIRSAWPRVAITAFIVGGTAWPSVTSPAPYVRGYAKAAEYVLRHSSRLRSCLFVGELNINFMGQVRRRDPDRRLWVVRFEKLFCGLVCEPDVPLSNYVKSDEDVLAMAYVYDPEFLVLETRRWYTPFALSDYLRQVVASHPERFQLQADIPLETNVPKVKGIHLLVYQNLDRNPNPEPIQELQRRWLQQAVETQGLRSTLGPGG
ncbi:MAG TPA: glycosyltransferase family 39 protein [Terriglobia bacterium]|nr:glycosyltransferase family 39 protein [Terriglobia bacterium]